MSTILMVLVGVVALVGMRFFMEANDRNRKRLARRLAAMRYTTEVNKGKAK